MTPRRNDAAGSDRPQLVLGLTGSNAAGKGEVAEHLRRCGFEVHSLSDIVREEAAAHGLPPEREHLIRIGNDLRQREGPGALAERIIARLGRRAVVDSIRNPVEVRVLRKLPRFVLLGVTAPLELRFQRGLARRRPGDPERLDDFRKREAQENTDDPNAQRLEATLALADHVVANDGSLDDLRHRLDRLLGVVEPAPRARGRTGGT